ncbi:hypothetical protein F5877DRAFT_81486 [Lentinula edodes]|nr:hypothetical protein F5877DRAFT_81486 [Lentinula edodes]
MNIPDEEIYNPCPRPNPAKSRIEPEEDLLKCSMEKTLPEEYRFNVRRWRLEPGYIKPRELFYGFGVDIQDFIDYHQRHQLPRPPPMKSRASLWYYIMDDVMEDLSARCRFKLQHISPLSPKYDYTIALYNSHHLSVTELEDDEEEDVIRTIKERFGGPIAAQKPQWFFLLEDSIH